MSSVKIVENIVNQTNGKQVPVLDFVRKHTPLAAVLSKATPSTLRATRDVFGNRKITTPDYSSMIHVHRTISQRNKDARLTLQMLPDLKLAIEMVVSLILSPKDMFNDEVIIQSDISDLLPSSIIQALQQSTMEYYRKNHYLADFLQHMLMEVFSHQGALPVAIIPENALDDIINNYNEQIGLEHFKKEFDLEKNIPHPIGLLGVPDYLIDDKSSIRKRDRIAKFGAKVSFDNQSFGMHRRINVEPKTNYSYIAFSKLLPSKDKRNNDWYFNSLGSNLNTNADELVIVTDNLALIKMPEYKDQSLRSRVSEVLSKKGYNKLQSSLEDIKSKYKQHQEILRIAESNKRKLTDNEVEDLIYKKRKFAFTPVASVRNNLTLKRNSIGEPLIKELDTACFIPVSVDGDYKRKLGGYVMIDEEGYPITTNTPSADEVTNLSEMVGVNGNFISTMNERSNNILNGKETTSMNDFMLRKFFTRTFSEVVEKDLIGRIKNGQYDNGVSLGTNEDFYWLMLTRCLKGQRTQLLWIPEEYLVYFAMDYDENGFGKSLLEDIRNITSMRIMLMVTGITASMRNSIGRTKVTIKLDEEDQDVDKTIEDIQDEIVKSRINPIPFGVNNVADISKYIQRACYEFEITGSNALPDMAVDFDQHTSSYPKPDEDLQQQLKDLSIEHIGLTSNMVDASKETSFAIQAATENLMTMKRIQRWQRKIIPQISEYIRKVTANSESQINSYRDIISSNYEQLQISKLKKHFGIKDVKMLQKDEVKKLIVEQCIVSYITSLSVDLPSPGSSTLQAQRSAFDEAADAYRGAIEYELNEAFFDSALQGEQIKEHVGAMKDIIVAHYMRRWRADNNYLPELSELTMIGEDGSIGVDIMDALETHIQALGLSTGGFFRRFRKFAELQDERMKDVKESNTEGSDYSSSSNSNDNDDGGDGGDDEGGENTDTGVEDDLSFDDPTG